MSWGVVRGSASCDVKDPVQPIIGRTTGKGCSGSVKETWSMGHWLTREWMVA